MEKEMNYLSDLEREIYELAGMEFDISSPKQLGEVLFEKLHLPNGKKRKTGYCTSEEVLLELSSVHPIVNKILDYRMYKREEQVKNKNEK